MKIKILITSLIVFMGSILTAYAGGSDSPTPYSVTASGITLTKPMPAHGHINIRLTDGTSKGIHLDPNNNQPGGAWIGKSFIPWSAFGLTEGCVAWVQVSEYNEHFGEGGQEPVCFPEATPTPTPSEDPTETPEPSISPSPSEDPTETPSPSERPSESPTPPSPTTSPSTTTTPTAPSTPSNTRTPTSTPTSPASPSERHTERPRATVEAPHSTHRRTSTVIGLPSTGN